MTSTIQQTINIPSIIFSAVLSVLLLQWLSKNILGYPLLTGDQLMYTIAGAVTFPLAVKTFRYVSSRVSIRVRVDEEEQLKLPEEVHEVEQAVEAQQLTAGEEGITEENVSEAREFNPSEERKEEETQRQEQQAQVEEQKDGGESQPQQQEQKVEEKQEGEKKQEPEERTAEQPQIEEKSETGQETNSEMQAAEIYRKRISELRQLRSRVRELRRQLLDYSVSD